MIATAIKKVSADHSHTILEPFTAVEHTAPPAQAHGRDQPV